MAAQQCKSGMSYTWFKSHLGTRTGSFTGREPALLCDFSKRNMGQAQASRRLEGDGLQNLFAIPPGVRTAAITIQVSQSGNQLTVHVMTTRSCDSWLTVLRRRHDYLLCRTLLRRLAGLHSARHLQQRMRCNLGVCDQSLT